MDERQRLQREHLKQWSDQVNATAGEMQSFCDGFREGWQARAAQEPCPEVDLGDWVPLHRSMNVECCTCGARHLFEFRVENGEPQWRATPIAEPHPSGELRQRAVCWLVDNELPNKILHYFNDDGEPDPDKGELVSDVLAAFAASEREKGL